MRKPYLWVIEIYCGESGQWWPELETYGTKAEARLASFDIKRKYIFWDGGAGRGYEEGFDNIRIAKYLPIADMEY